MDIADWGSKGLLIVNAGLMLIIVYLATIVSKHIVKLLRKADENSGKLGKIHAETIENRQRISRIGEDLCASTKNLWDELLNLRRTLDTTNMVLQRRRVEVDKLTRDQRRTEDRVDTHKKILSQTIKVLKRHDGRIELFRSKVVNLSDELIMIKKDEE